MFLLSRKGAERVEANSVFVGDVRGEAKWILNEAAKALKVRHTLRAAGLPRI